MELSFFKCAHCGQIIEKVKDTSVNVYCCGEPMSLIKENSTDAAQEKHVPVVSVSTNVVKVEVGSVMHPMTPEHLIEWVIVTTNKNCYKHVFAPGDAPVAVFTLQDDETVEKTYAYCNLHGLWVK